MKKESLTHETVSENLYNLDVFVSVNPEHHKPYEVNYKMEILDERFKKRLEKLSPYIFLTRSLLYFDVLIVTLVSAESLGSTFRDQSTKLLMNGEKATYNEDNQKISVKFQRRLENALRYYLDKESKEFTKLLIQEKSFSAS